MNERAIKLLEIERRDAGSSLKNCERLIAGWQKQIDEAAVEAAGFQKIIGDMDAAIIALQQTDMAKAWMKQEPFPKNDPTWVKAILAENGPDRTGDILEISGIEQEKHLKAVSVGFNPFYGKDA